MSFARLGKGGLAATNLETAQFALKTRERDVARRVRAPKPEAAGLACWMSAGCSWEVPLKRARLSRFGSEPLAGGR